MNDTHDKLDLLTTGTDRTTMAGTAFYAGIVRFARYALAIGILGIVVTIFIWPEIDNTAPREIPKDSPEVASNELVKPRFEAIDKSQQPYTITADRAVQDSKNADLIDMTKPVADMTLHDGSWMALEGDRGLYKQEAQTIDLTGHVRLYQDKGYELRGEHVIINMKTQNVVSTDPVEGQGPMGTLSAQGLSGTGEQGVMVFHGPATLILNQGALK